MGNHLNDLGRRIRTLRLSKNLTIEQLSERIGKSSNFVGNIERGEGAPAVQTLIDIANALNVGVDVLLQDSLSIFQNVDSKDDFHNQIKIKLQVLSKCEQKDILAMIDIMTHFKGISYKN